MEELSPADAEFELGSGECAVALIVVYLYGQERRTCTSVSEQPTNAILLFFRERDSKASCTIISTSKL